MKRDQSLVPLSHQHQHGLALCVLIRKGLESEQEPDPSNVAELQRKVASLWKAELQGHFQVEENTLFPTILAALDDTLEVVDLLTDQHHEIQEIVSAVAAAAGEEAIDPLLELAELLERHIRIEERELFQLVQARLAAAELADLGKRLERRINRICPVTEKPPWEEQTESQAADRSA